MKNIAVIFGGRSVEHDISILTGLHAALHVQNARVHYVYLNRENKMLTGGRLADIDYYITNVRPAKPCWFADGFLHFGCRRKVKIDAVLNCCHGGVGENGELAAYFRVVGVPVTSCDYISAANMQSKIRTREILTAAGFEQPKYASVAKSEWESGDWSLDRDCFVAGTSRNDDAEQSDSSSRNDARGDTQNDSMRLDFPVIVKPDTLGSSIGISVARSKEELADALELVFEMDKRAIIEEFFEGITEVNCAAMRVLGEVKVSGCEQIDSKREFLDYESKYLDPSSGFIKKGKEAEEEKDYSKIQELTRRAYELFGARGVVRADFILHGDKIFLNEINTVPGFLAYHLWLRAGLPYGLVIDLLLKQAVIDADAAKGLQTVFKSDILVKNRGLVH